MNTFPGTRKPIEELCLDDLDSFPIWEFASDEEGVYNQDETWVRPCDNAAISKGTGGLVVAADITTAGGTELEGFVSVIFVRSFMVHEGAILLRGMYLYVSSSLGRSEQDYVSECIGESEAGVFPLSWSLRVRVDGEDDTRKGSFAP